MNQKIIVLITTSCLIMGTTACSNRPNDNVQNSGPSSIAASSDESPMFAIEDNTSILSETSERIDDRHVNSALEKIPNFEDIPEDCLLGVKWYGNEIKWTEVNAIANLVRYNITEEPYFLFVPRYAGSQITISSMSGNSPDQVLYSEENCADDFGIIVNQKFIESNDPVQIRVTVSYGDKTAYYDFLKDGSSAVNHPIIKNGTFYTENIISPQYDAQIQTGIFLAYADYGHTGYGDFIYFSASMPSAWKPGEATVEAQPYIIYDKQINGITGNVKIWGYYCTETSGRTVRSFLTNYENIKEIQTAQDNKVYRSNTNQSTLTYSFMANDTLAVVVEISTITGTAPLYTAQVTDMQMVSFCDSFVVLEKAQGNEKDPVPNLAVKSYVQLTDGVGKTAATTVNIGDSFLGWTADKIEYYDDSNMIVKFSGKATVKCRLSYSALDEPFGNEVKVYVADESLPLLPSLTNGRGLWFILENEKEVIQALGGKAFDLPDCEIVIDSYTIYRRPAGVSDTANVQAINYAR